MAKPKNTDKKRRRSSASSQKENRAVNAQSPRLPDVVKFVAQIPTPEIKKSRVSLSKKAGLVFPARKFLNKMKKGNYAKIIQKGAAVYTSAVLEYLCAEVLELGIDAARTSKRGRVAPRHLMLAIRLDVELNKLLQFVTFPQSGVPELIHKALLKPKKKRPAKSGSGKSDQKVGDAVDEAGEEEHVHQIQESVADDEI